VIGVDSSLEVRGVGALAAGIVEQTAELVALLARQAGLGSGAAQAGRIAARASSLSARNEQAFSRAMHELDASIEGRGDEHALTQALARAAEVPLGVCEVASDLVLLTAELAEGSLAHRSADLCGAAQLAAAACRTAALLVGVNLTVGSDDARKSSAARISTAADHVARRLLEEVAGP
jgi:formiminotetrahydrofolate cyclodeaminase